MNTLVTGGLGFIGSNLVDKLVKMEDTVWVIDNLSSDSSSINYINPKVNYIYQSVEDINKIDELSNVNFDRIFHLAAKARIQPSFENPSDYFYSNSVGTLEVIEYSKNHNNGMLVYSSTSSKNHGTIYFTPYTFFKVVGEGILKTYANCFQTKCAIATFFNVYGPREPENGEWATVVAKFGRQLSKNEPLTVVGDGLQTRDFTHVDDICDGLLKISTGEWYGDNFDLGTGNPMSILDLAKLYTNNDMSKIKFIPHRKNEGQDTLSNYQETKEKIGWKSKVSLSTYVLNKIKC